MKQNMYDNPVFFEKYSQMERSQKGLAGAGEWETLQKMLPDFSGKTVLDLGCGFGWHCQYAASQGARSVLGLDLSEKMLEGANQKNQYPDRVRYLRQAIEDVEAEAESFDIALSSLALHYIADFPATVQKVFSLLRPGGAFVFSMEHPVFTAEGSQDWFYNEKGEILHFPVDRYFIEGSRQAVFLGETVTKYHRTLTTCISALIQAGFLLKDFAEPQPPAHMLEEIPGMKDELRRPMMAIFSAVKPE